MVEPMAGNSADVLADMMVAWWVVWTVELTVVSMVERWGLLKVG